MIFYLKERHNLRTHDKSSSSTYKEKTIDVYYERDVIQQNP